ncbi:TPA: hypothetical protein ACHFP7_003832 [Enterobacter hormaechei]
MAVCVGDGGLQVDYGWLELAVQGFRLLAAIAPFATFALPAELVCSQPLNGNDIYR